MKKDIVRQFRFWGVFVLCCCMAVGALDAFAQQGVSSFSSSRTRDASESQPATRNAMGRLVAPTAPERIAVEEIINYHRHQIPAPKRGQAVALDLRWGNDIATGGQPAVLQVGLATSELHGTSDLVPVNLGLVIDRSGSMASANKLGLVKAALQSLVSNLRPSDTVSIVVFSDDADLILPAGPLGDGRAYRRAIETITANGSTNLNSGLMAGYREVQRAFRSGSTNRVILLTDGVANVGESDPRAIARSSEQFNERGIDLTTIGVGQDLDNTLLRTLAKRGHGLYHFVADPEDVAKVFVSEAQSLLSAVARNVRVEIASDSSSGPERIFGYEPRISGNRATFDLDDLNSGATEVILLQYRPENVSEVTVRLHYFDLAKQKDVEETRRITLIVSRASERGRGNFLLDQEVRKNYTIALIAQGMSDMQQSWSRSDLRGAENFVRNAVRDARDQFPRMEDRDIRAQLDVAENYLSTLERFNGTGGGTTLSRNRD